LPKNIGMQFANAGCRRASLCVLAAALLLALAGFGKSEPGAPSPTAAGSAAAKSRRTLGISQFVGIDALPQEGIAYVKQGGRELP
jgi:hypothetical protein